MIPLNRQVITIYFKRNEPFRFTFDKPIPGKLYNITAENSSPVNVTILDVSNFGAKVYCEDKVKLEKDTNIKLFYMISGKSFEAQGSITWTKYARTSYEMGLHLNTDNAYHHSMIESLKRWKRSHNE